MMSKGVDEARRARAVGPGVPAAGGRQDEAPHVPPPNDADSRAREAAAGAALHDLAAAQEEEVAAHGDREATLALYLAPGLHVVTRMAETDQGHARATHTPRNQCSQAPKLRKQQVMAPQKALCRQTHSNISSRRRRRRQASTPIPTFPRGHHHHSPADSTPGMQLSHLHRLHRLHRRTIKVNGLYHLPRPWQARKAHNNHLRAGFHHTTPQAGLPSRALLPWASGEAVGRLRLRLRLIPLKDTQSSSSSSSSQGVSSMAGLGMAAVGTGGEAAAAADTAGEEDGDRS